MLLLGTYGGWAAAQATASIPDLTFVTGSSSCPDLDSVARESIRLTPVDQRDIFASGVRVQVDDLGERYRVSVFAPGLLASKTYFDPARACVRRTTVAAVLVFTTLMPPQFADAMPESDDEQQPSVPALAAPGQERRPPSPTARLERKETIAHSSPAGASLTGTISDRPSRVRLLLGIARVLAPAVGRSMSTAAWGVALRTSIGSGHLVPFLDATYASQSNFDLSGVSGAIRYSSVAAGLEWGHTVGVIDLAGSAGVVMAFQRIRGNDLVSVKSQSLTEFGARFGLTGAWHVNPAAPFFALALDTFPWPSDIVGAPRGRLGTTPMLHVWNILGLRLSL